MAERKEIGLPKTGINLKEQIARNILRNLRSQGHTYIELRKDGKRFVFFCILCVSPCYSETILHSHMNGKFHREIFSCAKLTLLLANPWPFSDGIIFFNRPTDGERVPGSDDNRVSFAKYDKDRTSGLHGDNQPAANNILIPGLLIKEKTVDVEAKFIGFGRIAARLFETKGHITWIDKIWCEWLGEEGPPDEQKAIILEHDFAIVTFTYFYGLQDDPSLANIQSAESGNGEDSSRKRKYPFSDPGDTSESVCNQYDSREEVSSSHNSNSSSAPVADEDDKLMKKRAKNKKRKIKRQLKEQQEPQEEVDDERNCDICKRKMLPGKDAAAILNLKTGKFACGSRNFTGAFHLYHMSCVVQWFLFCENDILRNKLVTGKGKKRARTQIQDLYVNRVNEHWTAYLLDSCWEIYSVFCPQCDGTGINLEGDVIERDTFQRSKTWKFLVAMALGRKAWIKDHEKLENCSIGFHFPQEAEKSGQCQFQGQRQRQRQVKVQEERVDFLKLVRFYRVDL